MAARPVGGASERAEDGGLLGPKGPSSWWDGEQLDSRACTVRGSLEAPGKRLPLGHWLPWRIYWGG